MGRHGGRSEEKISDLGYENEGHGISGDRDSRWWEDVPVQAERPVRAAEPWWDDAPVPPPVVVASADGRTPAVTFAPGADPFSAGGVFAPTGARGAEPALVVHPAPDAAVVRPARRRGLSASDTAALRLLDPGPDTGSLVRPYVPAVDATGEATEPAVDAPADDTTLLPPVRRGLRRTGGPLDLIVETSGPAVPLAADPVGEWSAPWAEAGEAPAQGRSLFEPRAASPSDRSATWAAPREQALPSRKALRAQERAGHTKVPAVKGARATAALAGNRLAGSALAGPEIAGRPAGRRLAKSGVLAVTAIGVVAASAPNAFSSMGLHLPSRPVGGAAAQAAIVGLAGSGALSAPEVSLSDTAGAVDDLAVSKTEAQQRAVDAQVAVARTAAARAAAARAGTVATGAGRTLVAVARDQARAEAARKAAIADRASRNVLRDPRAYARLLLSERGWGDTQFTCLNLLWNRESGWNYQAYNPSSGAYGIPQALPGSKMASIASDWRTNPATQIKWGLNYITDRYSTPCGAWGHSQATGWY